ncbi:MAG: hypothetical protein JSR97_07475 [Verrucomicrobia bacterium]|nr:hypothetical protein [Verrucomicrobiota bacterium]
MALKTLNFDVFKLITTNDQQDLVKFETILLNKLAAYRTLPKSSGPILLIGDISKNGKFIYGTLAHNQMNDLPPTLDSATGETGELPIKDTQGLAYYTSFLFDTELQMIAYESKQNGVSLKSFLEFFEMNYSLPPIESEIVIDPIEIQRLNKMSVIKKFYVKIAKVENGAIFNSNKASFKQIINSADGTNTNTLEYTITSARSKDGSLTLNKVKQMAKDLLKYKETEEVEKMVITGKETDEDPADVIDFIANKVRISIKVERKRFSTNFALKEKYDLLTEEYKKVHPHLIKAYKLKKI